MKSLQKYINKANTIFVIVTGTILLVSGIFYSGKVNNLEETINKKDAKNELILQRLDAGISFQSKRQMYILKSRDIIIKACKKAKIPMTSGEAFKIAESNLYYADKYGIDPVFKLAQQRRESLFDKNAISNAGAIGLNQIMPFTAKWLCEILDWEYDESMLYDIDKSNELSSLLVRMLTSHYKNNKELVLAAYNGGERQAYYYKHGSVKLAKETKEYIPIVMDLYTFYKIAIGTYITN
jgi:hypothetical protein